MKIITSNENPYGNILTTYFMQEFPEVSNPNNQELLEVLTNILIGTKETRYGSLPIPESQVVIRDAIRQAILNNTPIPILIPWGSIKSNFSARLDIAEVNAINRLICLSKSIKRIYIPGVEIVIRVEDTSGYELFSRDINHDMIVRNIDLYSKDFKNLVKILCPDGSIRVIFESEMSLASQYKELSYHYTDIIEEYLIESKEMIKFAPLSVYSLPSYQSLIDQGWRGIISQEQRDHYLSTYARLYPNLQESDYIRRLALYLGGALTRAKLNMTGKQSYWSYFIQIVFVPPVKGIPEGYNYNYLFYRTLPLSQARTHMPAWRGKGYFKINGNELVAKITSFGDVDTISQLITSEVELCDTERKVIIQTDYLLES
jgi:hypothetical protein